MLKKWEGLVRNEVLNNLLLTSMTEKNVIILSFIILFWSYHLHKLLFSSRNIFLKYSVNILWTFKLISTVLANTCYKWLHTHTHTHKHTHTRTHTVTGHNSISWSQPPRPKDKLFSPSKYSKHQKHTTFTEAIRMQQQRHDLSQKGKEKSTFGPAILFPLWGAASTGRGQRQVPHRENAGPP